MAPVSNHENHFQSNHWNISNNKEENQIRAASGDGDGEWIKVYTRQDYENELKCLRICFLPRPVIMSWIINKFPTQPHPHAIQSKDEKFCPRTKQRSRHCVRYIWR